LQSKKGDEEEGDSLVEKIKEEMKALSEKLDDIYDRVQVMATIA